jgi:hypothetical protein
MAAVARDGSAEVETRRSGVAGEDAEVGVGRAGSSATSV